MDSFTCTTGPSEGFGPHIKTLKWVGESLEANCSRPTVSEAGEEHTISETLYLGVWLNVPFHHCYFRAHNAVCPGTCAHADLCELVTRRVWVHVCGEVARQKDKAWRLITLCAYANVERINQSVCRWEIHTPPHTLTQTFLRLPMCTKGRKRNHLISGLWNGSVHYNEVVCAPF